VCSPIVISRDVIGLLRVGDSQRDFYRDGQLLELELSGDDVGLRFFNHEGAEETRIQLQEIAGQRIVLAHHTTSEEGNRSASLGSQLGLDARRSCQLAPWFNETEQ